MIKVKGRFARLAVMAFFLLLQSSCFSIPTVPEDGGLSDIIAHVTPEQAFSLIAENAGNPDFIILDVRTPGEFPRERLAGAVNLDFRAPGFPAALDGLDRNRTYLVYCQAGVRSGSALRAMSERGFRRVYNMREGIAGWKARGYPVDPAP